MMSGKFEDFIVKRRSREEIERVAEALARRHGISGPVTKVVEVLRSETRSSFSLLSGWTIAELPIEQMPLDEGRADFTQKLLEFRQGVLSGAESGRHRDRMTVSHEMGHVLLDHKDGDVMHRVQQGNKKLGFGRQEESAEWQARYFASAFLMSRGIVEQCSNATEISLQCRVSLQAAQIRFDEIKVRGVAKSTPQEIQAEIDKLRQQVRSERNRPKQQTVLNAEQQRKLAWIIAPEYPGHDPNEYRLIDGVYVVRFSRFGLSVAGGWHLMGERIIPWDANQGRN
jgi:Zn-dependent peptidase ImmA (M78 family)